MMQERKGIYTVSAQRILAFPSYCTALKVYEHNWHPHWSQHIEAESLMSFLNEKWKLEFQTVISKREHLHGSLAIHQSILTLSRVISSKSSKGAWVSVSPGWTFSLTLSLAFPLWGWFQRLCPTPLGQIGHICVQRLSWAVLILRQSELPLRASWVWGHNPQEERLSLKACCQIALWSPSEGAHTPGGLSSLLPSGSQASSPWHCSLCCAPWGGEHFPCYCLPVRLCSHPSVSECHPCSNEPIKIVTELEIWGLYDVFQGLEEVRGGRVVQKGVGPGIHGHCLMRKVCLPDVIKALVSVGQLTLWTLGPRGHALALLLPVSHLKVSNASSAACLHFTKSCAPGLECRKRDKSNW